MKNVELIHFIVQMNCLYFYLNNSVNQQCLFILLRFYGLIKFEINAAFKSKIGRCVCVCFFITMCTPPSLSIKMQLQ